MTLRSETFLMLVVLTNFALLGSNRLAAYIRIVAVQGFILGLLTLSIHYPSLPPRIWLVALGNVALKGFLFPWLFFKTMEKIHIKREVEPIIGYTLSIFIGALLFGASLWMAQSLPLPSQLFSSLSISVSLFTLMVGFFLMVSRNKAITQAIGYIVIENGIYIFGMTFMQEAPMMIELGVLLDLFVGIFVMQIILHHIRREFDSLNVKYLSNLKDWEP